VSSWLIALAILSSPPKYPGVVGTSALRIQSKWEQVKDIALPTEQLSIVEQRRLRQLTCKDSVDITTLVNNTKLPLRLRDVWRERTHARPELFALVMKSLMTLKKALPGAAITIGDVSQEGCGQIRYGTVTRGLRAKATTRWAKSSYVDTGVYSKRYLRPASWYIAEWPRFGGRLGPIIEEWRLVGRKRDGSGLFEVQRLGEGALLAPETVERLGSRTRKRLSDKKRVIWDRVYHQHRGTLHRVRRARWFHAQEKRQVEVLFRPKARVRPLRVRNLIRVREARLDLRKPTSPKYEERYEISDDGEAAVQVWRHRLEYEAHHSSHLGGLDADLSYVTDGNRGHFAPRDATLDPVGTWLWLDTIRTSALELGIPLKALFVAPSILRILREGAGQKKSHPLWKKLRRSPGHDSHVHVRILPAARWSGRTAESIIESLQKY
jgi:hypothetical protein